MREMRFDWDGGAQRLRSIECDVRGGVRPGNEPWLAGGSAGGGVVIRLYIVVVHEIEQV
jgi:hypothetical protein